MGPEGLASAAHHCPSLVALDINGYFFLLSLIPFPSLPPSSFPLSLLCFNGFFFVVFLFACLDE
jgi:hypothetical protein